MQVVLEPIGKQFRASSRTPFEISAEGETREAALIALREVAAHRLQNGVEIVDMPLPGEELPARPYLRFAGDQQNNPLFDEWQESIQNLRRARDREEGIEYSPDVY